MSPRPKTFAEAYAEVKKSDHRPSLEETEEKLFNLLKREVEKLRPASLRVAKSGRKISAARLQSLKTALSMIQDIIDEADAAPDGQVDAVKAMKAMTNIAKAAALVCAAVEDNTLAPIIENLRKRAADTLEHLAERERQRTPGLTAAQAYAKALDTPAGQGAYAAYDEAQRRGEPFEIAPPEPVAKRTEESPAWARICKLADALVTKSDKPLTREMAIEKVLDEHPALYEAYEREAGRVAKAGDGQSSSLRDLVWARVQSAASRRQWDGHDSRSHEQIIGEILAQRPALYSAWTEASPDPLPTPGPGEPSLDSLVDRYLAASGIRGL